MTDRIETLTPEQEAMLPQVVEEWLDILLSTEPANRPAAEAGVAKAYKEVNVDPPRMIIWVDSPLAGAFAQGLLQTPEAWEDAANFVDEKEPGPDNIYIKTRNMVYREMRKFVAEKEAS